MLDAEVQKAQFFAICYVSSVSGLPVLFRAPQHDYPTTYTSQERAGCALERLVLTGSYEQAHIVPASWTNGTVNYKCDCPLCAPKNTEET